MKFIYTLLFTLITVLLWGQDSNQAPLDADFVKQTVKSGYVYPPYKVEHNTIRLKSSEILPEQFDLRDVDGVSFVSGIRNQNPYGTCWTFGAYASLESNWRMSGDATFTDLSEGNMAKCHGYEFGINDGGNEYMSTAYLARHAGPLYESSDPYNDVTNNTCIAINKTTDIPAYIDNVIWIGDDRDLVKSTIMNHGVVATSMYSGLTSLYYNSYDYTFFYEGSDAPNHGVSIVGWDDNKVVTGGSECSPSQTGAWIVRNSWGTGVQDSGYFYASYEDKYIGRSTELYSGKTAYHEIDTLFDYAELGGITAHKVEDTSNIAYAVVKYHAHKDMLITHLGASILAEGTYIDFAICESFDGQHLSDTIAHLSDVFYPYAGYQKQELPCLIEQGDYYLALQYNTPTNDFPLPVETVIEYYCSPNIEEGKLWVSKNGLEWIAGGANTDYEFDLAVKVYAQYTDDINPHFSVDKSDVCTDQEVVFTNNSTGAVDSFVWVINNETFTTENKSESVNYTFSEVGTKAVILHAYKDGIAYTFEHTDAISVIDEVSPHIIVVNASDYYSKGKPITLIGTGGDTYQWYADGYLNGESGQIITFSPDQDQIWIKVVSTLGTCTGTDSVLINMVEAPYDDIVDALELEIGTPATNISNLYATVQSNEPYPSIGSCTSQNTWCEEGGLQNSIWFKFSAPSSGTTSITTSGFDNQIALYDAISTGTWEDILSGDPSTYNIIAANDDYSDTEYEAIITEVNGLTPNKTYWIQMDGSAGGTTGLADIRVGGSGPVSNDIEADQNYSITNTPTEFKLSGENLTHSQVSIINSLGQVLYTNTISSGHLQLSNSNLSPGVYFISLRNENSYSVYKTVISNQWQMTIEER